MSGNGEHTSIRLLAVVCVMAILAGCSRPTTLEQVRSEGVLHVITRHAPSIYYEGRNGPTGFEYELVQRFAKSLGVELRVRVVEGNAEILSILDRNYAHIGLAGLTASPDRKANYQTVPTTLATESIVIYNRDVMRPGSIDDLIGSDIHVVGDSNHIRHLEQLAPDHQGLNWHVHADLDTAGILQRVESGEFPFAVVDANELALNHIFFPDIKRGFSLNEPEKLAWLFPPQQDDTLVKAAQTFFAQVEDDGSLAQIKERFYGHLDRLNYVGARTFVHHVRNRLPQYETLFQDYSEKYGIDWRLLAAIGYQESHWRPNAVSPTGVRGIMMLTRNTASYIGIDNRLDPEKSIKGGARYFRKVHEQIPADIPEPDRTWFALASYNVGYGHLEDARRLTEGAGRDPDRWMDVKEFLPLLAQKEWYSKTRFGYARGHEPVTYVQNIRRYYDVLAWMKDPADATDEVANHDAFNMTPEPVSDDSMSDDRPLLPKALGQTPPTL
ncbi:membrane-bound lytic murein transglycosylase MltF [Marinobacter caseinilyticus]|uniref:membrane-bound lytic murein transglycosylase MltF n=1 Tax=Marinobacter caseinilyticus TaxID=2692195 RepID=UPI00140A933B|nr:membrane-bound lytic murein transglycosylase MltF [Marinobacter caseinilyticus]